MADGFRAMPSNTVAGSGLLEEELVAWANAYAERHAPGTYGGAWIDWSRGYSIAHAGFTADVEAHRAALDPRLRVVEVGRSLIEWQVLRSEIEDFVRAFRDVRLDERGVELDLDQRVIRLTADTAHEAAFEAGLAARFAGEYDLYLERWLMEPRAVRGWKVDANDQELTMFWVAAGLEDPKRAEVSVDERVDEIAVSLRCCVTDGPRRAATSSGQELHWGLAGPDEWVEQRVHQLRAPRAGRPVVDASHGQRVPQERPRIRDR